MSPPFDYASAAGVKPAATLALMSDRPPPPGRRPSGGAGCWLWVVAFLVITFGGCIVGLALRPGPDEPDEASDAVALATDESAAKGWTLRGRTDEAGEPCTELFEGGKLRTGQCGFGAGRYQATSAVLDDGRVVIFGPVPDEVARVRLRLEDGSRPSVATRTADGFAGRFFVYESDGVADRGPTELLDESGAEVEA